MNELIAEYAVSRKWLALFGGAGLFLSVQGFLFLSTGAVEGITNSGWFLNSRRGLHLVAMSCFVVGALIGLGKRDSVREAIVVASGAEGACTHG
jgi:hypothetical protein